MKRKRIYLKKKKELKRSIRVFKRTIKIIKSKKNYYGAITLLEKGIIKLKYKLKKLNM